tara:strand:- start:2438 stop:2893 length:456 start_codon:yes stop_codon:yes gene_type:complete
MTNNWINTQAGNRFAFHTIPKLTNAVKRIGDILAGMQEDPYGEEITPETVRDAFRDMKMKEREQVTSWEPTELEILLYRALSRAYCAPRGVMEEGDDTFDEAYHALAIASHDFRNALTCHTFVVEDEIADDNPQRIDWEYCSILNAADALD